MNETYQDWLNRSAAENAALDLQAAKNAALFAELTASKQALDASLKWLGCPAWAEA